VAIAAVNTDDGRKLPMIQTHDMPLHLQQPSSSPLINEDTGMTQRKVPDSGVATRKSAARAQNTDEQEAERIATTNNEKENKPNDDSVKLSAAPQELLLTTRTVIMYSKGRLDRSGSVIADMLYAHAYSYHHNYTYGGACHDNVKGHPRPATVQLLESMGWSHILPFACPSLLEESPQNSAAMKDVAVRSILLEGDVYRVRSLLNSDWRQHIRREGFMQHNSSTNNNNNKRFEIAVHVRRGDVSPCKHRRRYLPNEHYMTLIHQYMPQNHDNVHVTVYSESDSFESFDVFRNANYTVVLDTPNLADLWKAFVSANVLILSRSFFSFVPAAVNSNTVVATDFFGFDPLPGWHTVDKALVARSDEIVLKMAQKHCQEHNIPHTIHPQIVTTS